MWSKLSHLSILSLYPLLLLPSFNWKAFTFLGRHFIGEKLWYNSLLCFISVLGTTLTCSSLEWNLQSTKPHFLRLYHLIHLIWITFPKHIQLSFTDFKELPMHLCLFMSSRAHLAISQWVVSPNTNFQLSPSSMWFLNLCLNPEAHLYMSSLLRKCSYPSDSSTGG